MMSKLDSVLERYRETFDEQFPLMLVQGVPESDLTRRIQACIDQRKPYEYDDESGEALY